jgi:hypothetical protein
MGRLVQPPTAPRSDRRHLVGRVRNARRATDRSVSPETGLRKTSGAPAPPENPGRFIALKQVVRGHDGDDGLERSGVAHRQMDGIEAASGDTGHPDAAGGKGPLREPVDHPLGFALLLLRILRPRRWNRIRTLPQWHCEISRDERLAQWNNLPSSASPSMNSRNSAMGGFP